MKSFKLGLATTALCALGTMLITTNAGANDFPQTAAAAQASVTQGFNQPSLPLLHRKAAANADTVSATLTAKLCSSLCSASRTVTRDGNLRLVGDHWSLNIVSDGTAAEFQDSQVLGRAHSLGKDPLQKMSAAALEQAGRAFISSKLSSVIVLGAGEELIPVRTDYRREWGQDLHTGATTTAVVANRVVFGRALHGVAVVGGGSTVVVTFGNDGAVESFRYDWPKYDTAANQSVVGVDKLLHRVQTAVNSRNQAWAPPFTIIVPSSHGPAYPVALGPDTALQILECGYYDPGFTARDAKAPVQSGCVYHALFQGPDGMRAGLSGAVPGGTDIVLDNGWPESKIFGGRSD